MFENVWSKRDYFLESGKDIFDIVSNQFIIDVFVLFYRSAGFVGVVVDDCIYFGICIASPKIFWLKVAKVIVDIFGVSCNASRSGSGSSVVVGNAFKNVCVRIVYTGW